MAKKALVKTEEKPAETQKKRAAIYVIYDKDGVLSEYREYFLKELKKVTDRIVVVANGVLNPESRDKLYEITDDFFVRENSGYDSGAFRAGMNYISWDTLQNEYDELILCNDSMLGPIYPFAEIFGKMEDSDADIWSIQKIFGNKDIHTIRGDYKFPNGVKETLTIPFCVVRKKYLRSYEFKEWWTKDFPIKNYGDASYFNEFGFSEYLRNSGFRLGFFMDDTLKSYADNLATVFPYKCFLENNINLFKIKAFENDSVNTPYFITLRYCYGKEPRQLLEHLDKHTNFDTGLIWDTILRKSNLYDIWLQNQLEYIVPKDYVKGAYTYKKKIAVIAHIYYADLVEEAAYYGDNFPKDTDFYITVSSEETEAEVKRIFAEKKFSFTVTLIPNVGRDVPALWVTYAHIVTGGEYDYICFYHDKKSNHGQFSASGETYKLNSYENLFGTKNVVKNVINLFEQNKRLGVLGAKNAYHAFYFASVQSNGHRVTEQIIKFAKKLDLKVPFFPNKTMCAPYGSVFWFRADALKKAVGTGFDYSDFDVGLDIDGTVLHAIERMYGIIAQDSGYYYANVINDDNARSDLVNYQYMLNDLVDIIKPYVSFYSYEQLKINLTNYMQNSKNAILDAKGKPAVVSMAHMTASEYAKLGINQQEFLEIVSTKLLIKKLVKRLIPKSLWNRLHEGRAAKIAAHKK
ncbi:hypothetical protein AGMMS49975_00550 [Clostridia bacterium]|nr:hypothetical protein AGMMS49975_00550 [Clostridia bacterium]